MEISITATFNGDSKRFHRFMIDEGEGITGSIYIPKGKQIPEKVTIQLKTAGDKE